MKFLKSNLIKFALRLSMILYIGLLYILKKIRRFAPKVSDDSQYDILLTGTFYSDNWIIPHLFPLASSKYCRRVRMVAATPVPSKEKVEGIYPPQWLVKIFGKTAARMLIFVWIALRDRPHILGGFHMLPNGLVAVLIAKLIGAKSLYFCGGGPREILGGGFQGNPIFAKLQNPDRLIERILFAALASFDFVITMGSGALCFFKQHANTNYYIVPGGFESKKFYPSNIPAENDLILVGRLTAVKRVDLFLQAVKLTREVIPDVTAVVVGGGPLLHLLEQKANKLGLKDNVKFVGHQNNVEEWLRQSKIFVLTSESEGVSQAMIQAMLCKLPPVVSDVGDLSDLVKNDYSGFLVDIQTPECFAACFSTLLKESKKLREFGNAAYQVAEKYTMENVSITWDEILKIS